MSKSEPIAGMNKPLDQQTNGEMKANFLALLKSNQFSKDCFRNGQECFTKARVLCDQGFQWMTTGLESIDAVERTGASKSFEIMDELIVDVVMDDRSYIQSSLFSEEDAPKEDAPRRRGKGKNREAVKEAVPVVQKSTHGCTASTPYTVLIDALMVVAELNSLKDLAKKAGMDVSTARKLYNQSTSPTNISGSKWSRSTESFAKALDRTPENLLGDRAVQYNLWKNN
jgi:hypothetical protein